MRHLRETSQRDSRNHQYRSAGSKRTYES